MASGAFSPKTALLLLPLVSSTSTLLFSFDQHSFLSVLTHPALVQNQGASSNAVISPYFSLFFPRGLVRVVTFLGVTTWSSVGCIYSSRVLLRSKGSLAWYAGAAALAVGHLLFVPVIAQSVKSILDNKGGDVAVGDAGEAVGDAKNNKKKSNVDYMKDWLRVNMVRTLTTDLGAWVCAVIAVTKTFSD
ncbi:mRNA splicing protein [Amphichorda felina]